MTEFKKERKFFSCTDAAISEKLIAVFVS